MTASVTAGSARAVCAIDTAAGAIGVVSSRSVYSSDSTMARASCPFDARRGQVRQRVQLVPQGHQHRVVGLEPHRLQQRPGQGGQHPETVVVQRRQLGLQPRLVVRGPHARVHQAARVHPHLLELVAHPVGVRVHEHREVSPLRGEQPQQLAPHLQLQRVGQPGRRQQPPLDQHLAQPPPGGQRRRHLGSPGGRAPCWTRRCTRSSRSMSFGRTTCTGAPSRRYTRLSSRLSSTSCRQPVSRLLNSWCSRRGKGRSSSRPRATGWRPSEVPVGALVLMRKTCRRREGLPRDYRPLAVITERAKRRLARNPQRVPNLPRWAPRGEAALCPTRSWLGLSRSPGPPYNDAGRFPG